ncbi:hypothetical protein FB382_001247 [Nocardioides ginsengisegetis]|uniref:Uncharacterized protein n=1 Tax=Nocardioides ginsengisegetis TaxID=661491 RepID=A0A7W3IYF0_9ACTN|nr:hypothetical protein [Nocardioides ginsengisegetis]MBA8802956.1 hypothetical protein [Nocardioides ginsengisegetis]
MHRWVWWLGVLLGGLLVVAGVAETVRLLVTGDGGLWFWFPTLVGGGALVITGTVLLPHSPARGRLLTTIGALAAVLPTMWTVLVPVLLVVLMVATAREAAALEAGRGRTG